MRGGARHDYSTVVGNVVACRFFCSNTTLPPHQLVRCSGMSGIGGQAESRLRSLENLNGPLRRLCQQTDVCFRSKRTFRLIQPS